MIVERVIRTIKRDLSPGKYYAIIITLLLLSLSPVVIEGADTTFTMEKTIDEIRHEATKPNFGPTGRPPGRHGFTFRSRGAMERGW